MLQQLTFKNKDMETDFLSTRQNFHLLCFKTLIVFVIIQSVAIYFTNPLNLHVYELSKILTLITSVILSILFYLLITKKLEKFCYLALPACVLLIILGASEYLLYLGSKIQLDSWMYFLLGINVEAGCLFLLVSRIKWAHSFLVLSFVHIYSWIRITDIYKHTEGKTTAIISLCIHIFFLFTMNYSSEKGDRDTFQKLKVQNLQLKVYEDLLKRVIPNIIIVMREGRIEFLNEVARNYFGLTKDEEIINILQQIKISNKNPEKALDYQSNTQFRNNLSNKNILDLANIVESSTLFRNSNSSKELSCDEVEFINDVSSEKHQNFSCHIGPFLWDNKFAVLIILSDVSHITHHYKRLDKYKDNLLATVSHDFRTPLNGMLGMLELLLEEVAVASQREYLQVLMNSSKLLLSMTNDILDFSLISKGQLGLKYEKTNVTTLIEETVRILDFQAKTKGVMLEVQNEIIDRNETHIIDGNRLRQVLLNLLGNAIKFTKLGKVTLRVSEEAIDGCEFISLEDILRNHKKFLVYDEIQEPVQGIDSGLNKKRLLFEVEDTGIGIKKNDINKLFKLFSKVGDDEGQNKSGIGLGLAISQSLVILMNGNKEGAEIKVESEYNKGSKFSFPLYLEEEPSTFFKEIPGFDKNTPHKFDVKTFNFFQSYDLSPTINLVSEADSLIITKKKKLSILIVDDDPINVVVAKNYMRSYDDECLISTANNGKEAIEAILNSGKQNACYDVILMDCDMPIMDGYEATQKLKLMMNSKILPVIPIIATTGNVDLSDKERCFLSGVDFYLAKPYSKLLLIDTIKEALSK